MSKKSLLLFKKGKLQLFHKFPLNVFLWKQRQHLLQYALNIINLKNNGD